MHHRPPPSAPYRPVHPNAPVLAPPGPSLYRATPEPSSGYSSSVGAAQLPGRPPNLQQPSQARRELDAALRDIEARAAVLRERQTRKDVETEGVLLARAMSPRNPGGETVLQQTYSPRVPGDGISAASRQDTSPYSPYSKPRPHAAASVSHSVYPSVPWCSPQRHSPKRAPLTTLPGAPISSPPVQASDPMPSRSSARPSSTPPRGAPRSPPVPPPTFSGYAVGGGAEMDVVRAELAAVRSEVQALRDRATEEDAAIAAGTLSLPAPSSSGEVEALRAEVQQLKRSREVLASELDSLRGKMWSASEASKAAGTSSSPAGADTASTEVRELREVNEALREALGSRESEQTVMRHELRTREEEGKELRAEVEILRAHATAAGGAPEAGKEPSPTSGDIAALRAEMESLQRQASAHHSEVEALRSDLRARDEAVATLRAETGALKALQSQGPPEAAPDLSGELNDLRKEVENLRSRESAVRQREAKAGKAAKEAKKKEEDIAHREEIARCVEEGSRQREANARKREKEATELVRELRRSSGAASPAGEAPRPGKSPQSLSLQVPSARPGQPSPQPSPRLHSLSLPVPPVRQPSPQPSPRHSPPARCTFKVADGLSGDYAASVAEILEGASSKPLTASNPDFARFVLGEVSVSDDYRRGMTMSSPGFNAAVAAELGLDPSTVRVAVPQPAS
eukprot:Hpha_TRINITY_DN1690_c0_g2::TRINITY_DN1690_c0_g2_i1::g.48803::m.48803